ncbi:MAG TPA: YceI family protein [Steroidobacteraceae bacterium]|nr:YceI family protein [Steroidobacteraceae bacterium]
MRYPKLSAVLAVTVLAAGALGYAHAADAPALTSHYTLDPAKSSLEFTFLQAGAKNTGRFPRFGVSLDLAGANPEGGRLEVTVEVAALDTGDKDRDDTLRSDDLFAVAKFPQAHFLSTRIVKTATGYEAEGALTIRGVTRDAKVPFTFREAKEGGAGVGYLAGKTLVRRLDFGVGRGEWKSTDQAGNDVTVSFALRLTVAH